MQLWLVAMAAIAFWRADVLGARQMRRGLFRGELSPQDISALLQLVGYGLVAVSVVITIRAGGTVG